MHKNKTVIFVAVIDNRGKLLLGQSSTKDCAIYKRGVEAIKSSSSHDALSFSGPKNEAYQFFNICIVPLVNLSANADRDAEVIPLYDMISPVNKFVKIGIMPLNERKDRFLCVYTDHKDIETQILA